MPIQGSINRLIGVFAGAEKLKGIEKREATKEIINEEAPEKTSQEIVKEHVKTEMPNKEENVVNLEKAKISRERTQNLIIEKRAQKKRSYNRLQEARKRKKELDNAS